MKNHPYLRKRVEKVEAKAKVEVGGQRLEGGRLEGGGEKRG